MDIVDRIREKQDTNTILNILSEDPSQIQQLIETLANEKSAVKFGCEKVLRLTSESKPGIIYPYFDFFTGLLDSENNFLKYGGILTIANLTSIDEENKFEKIFSKYYSFITGEQLIPANNVIKSSVKIAENKPKLLDMIVDEILKVETAVYFNKGEASPECKNIACGGAVKALYKLYPETTRKNAVFDFVNRQRTNTRNSVQQAAGKFIKRYSTKD